MSSMFRMFPTSHAPDGIQIIEKCSQGGQRWQRWLHFFPLLEMLKTNIILIKPEWVVFSISDSSAARPCRRHRPMGRCWIRPAGMSAGYPRSPTGFNVNLLVY